MQDSTDAVHYCVHADFHRSRDLFIALTLGDQVQHFNLSWSQSVWIDGSGLFCDMHVLLSVTDTLGDTHHAEVTAGVAG